MARVTDKDLHDADAKLASISFYPQGIPERTSIKLELAAMCPNTQALIWLSDAAARKWNKWPGMSAIRELLCSRICPADGIDPSCAPSEGYPGEDARLRSAEHRHELAERQRLGLPMPTSAPEPQKLLGGGRDEPVSADADLEALARRIAERKALRKQVPVEDRPAHPKPVREPTPELVIGEKRSPEQTARILKMLEARLEQQRELAGMK